ncbi:hypothetical protein Q5P01_000703 [Channa striata]|uniref:Murine leukemia virus integrase C-terminal domain-containing protein n=1 Tax=Channa striata TaxID=64152 RepID=A0AA88IYV4_CHASR|nr:hypothetical protein Q5P01_000703 [Channa striata]
MLIHAMLLALYMILVPYGNFLKSDGRPILHHDKVAALLNAILLPKAIAVCKCAAHTNNTDSVSLGNGRADAAAEAAARLSLPQEHTLFSDDTTDSPPVSLTAVQSFSTLQERQHWKTCGAVFSDDVWWSPDNKPSFQNTSSHILLTVSQIYQKVKAALPSPVKTTPHAFKPGDWVIVRELFPKHWRSRKWNGPFQVLLTTHTAVKVAERATWIHTTHCNKVPEPEDDFSQAVHNAHRRAVASRESGSQSEENTH